MARNNMLQTYTSRELGHLLKGLRSFHYTSVNDEAERARLEIKIVAVLRARGCKPDKAA